MQGVLNSIGVAAKKAGLVLVVGELLGDGGQVKYSDLSQGHPKCRTWNWVIPWCITTYACLSQRWESGTLAAGVSCQPYSRLGAWPSDFEMIWQPSGYLGSVPSSRSFVPFVLSLLSSGAICRVSRVSAKEPRLVNAAEKFGKVWCFSERMIPKIEICPEWWVECR